MAVCPKEKQSKDDDQILQNVKEAKANEAKDDVVMTENDENPAVDKKSPMKQEQSEAKSAAAPVPATGSETNNK